MLVHHHSSLMITFPYKSMCPSLCPHKPHPLNLSSLHDSCQGPSHQADFRRSLNQYPLRGSSLEVETELRLQAHQNEGQLPAKWEGASSWEHLGGAAPTGWALHAHLSAITPSSDAANTPHQSQVTGEPSDLNDTRSFASSHGHGPNRASGQRY